MSDGWFANCCLTDPVNPLTHTLGYVLRGLIAGYEFSGDNKILHEACQTARRSVERIAARWLSAWPARSVNGEERFHGHA